MRIAFEDGAVHERARVTFVSVADDVFLVRRITAGEIPLHASGETTAASAPQAALLDSIDHLGRGHVGQDLAQGLVAVGSDVFVNIFRIDGTAVAQSDTELLLVEGHILVFTDALLESRFDIQQTINDTAFDAVFVDNLLGVFRLDFDIEDIIRVDLDDRAFFAETEATGRNDLDFLGQSGGLDLFFEILDNLHAV